MKKFLLRSLLILIAVAALGTIGPVQRSVAQGVQRLSTFTGGAQVTGISYPCTVSCFILITSGTFTANGATEVVVPATNVTANSTIIVGLKTAGGTILGTPYMSSVTVGTSFGMKAGASDTSVYNFLIFN